MDGHLPVLYFLIFCCPAYLHSVSLCYRFAETLLPFATGRWSPRLLLLCFRLSYQTTAVYWCSVLRTFCRLYSRLALQCLLAEQPFLKDSHWSVLRFPRPRRFFYIIRLPHIRITLPLRCRFLVSS